MFTCICCVDSTDEFAPVAERINVVTDAMPALSNRADREAQSQAPAAVVTVPKQRLASKRMLETVAEELVPVEPEPVAWPASATSEELKICTDWEVTVSKSSDRDKVGLCLKFLSPTCATVQSIEDGALIWEWNKSHPEKMVTYGDAIMTVNGATDATSMVGKLFKESSLTIRFRRVAEFTVHVKKSSGGLGIALFGPASSPAEIVQIDDGKAISEYNKGAEPGKAVLPGDLVVSVNGEAGTTNAIASAITKASGILELKIQRPSAERPTQKVPK